MIVCKLWVDDSRKKQHHYKDVLCKGWFFIWDTSDICLRGRDIIMKVAERIRKTTKTGTVNRLITSLFESIKSDIILYENLAILTCIFIDGSKLVFRDYNSEMVTAIFYLHIIDQSRLDLEERRKKLYN